MIQETMSTDRVRRFYNWLGPRHDLGARFERRAKQRALDLLAAAPGERVLNPGAGTGKEQAALARAVGPDGLAAAVDISPVMLRLTRGRAGGPVCAADVRRLPFASGAFDALYCSYVLDLIPAPDLPPLVAEFRRVLRPGGRLALVSMTPGVDRFSQGLIALWQLLYRASPIFLGGCRPIQLEPLARGAALEILAREVVVQGGVPSEVLLARR